MADEFKRLTKLVDQIRNISMMDRTNQSILYKELLDFNTEFEGLLRNIIENEVNADNNKKHNIGLGCECHGDCQNDDLDEEEGW